jgi:xanthine dehydrogenase molybdenum-binding subunit
MNVVGRPTPRVDGFDKVSGLARYSSDLALPGMLHAKCLRSPYPHARVKRIDARKAESLLGVRAVLTRELVKRALLSLAVRN